jgi:hypothetical protein
MVIQKECITKGETSMKESGKKGMTLFVTLGFILSVLAVFAPVGGTAGRVGNFTVTVAYANETGSPITDYKAALGAAVTITGNATTSVEDATLFTMALYINSEVFGTNYSAPLIMGEYAENAWTWTPTAYASYTIFVVAINGTDETNQTPSTSDTFTIEAVDFSMGSVTATPSAGLIGIDDISIAAEVLNAGNIAGTANVSFKLDNSQLLGYKEVNVGAEASATATLVTNFEGLTISDGNHTVTAAVGGSSNVSDNITLTNPVADIIITGVDASPNPVTIEKGMTLNVTITAHIKNNGTKADTGFPVKFYENDMTTPKETVTVADTVNPGDSMDVKMNWTITDTVTLGDHSVYVGVGSESAEPYWMFVNVTVNGLANVTISNFTVTPASPFENDTVTLSVKLFNNGTADALNLTVQYFDGTALVNSSINITAPKGVETVVPIATANIGTLTADTNKTYKAKIGTSEMTVTVLARDKVPKIEVVTFTVGEGRIGDNATFTATVKNNGTGEAINITVDFYDGTSKVGSSAPFNLTVGSSVDKTATIKLSGTADANHTFYARIASVGVTEKSVTKPVNHTLSEPSIYIVSMLVKPTKLEGQAKDSTKDYKITIVLKNSGEKAGSVVLNITEGKKLITAATVNLGANETYNNTFTWKVKGDGDHKAVAVITGNAGTPSTKDVKATLHYTPGFELLALVGAIIVALVLVRRRKN